MHKNAALTPAGRACLVARVLVGREPMQRVAIDMGVSPRTGWKWLARWRIEGRLGLFDRSSRPHHSPTALGPGSRRRIRQLRIGRRWSSLRIAHHVGIPLPTVVRTLRRLGLNRLPRREPPLPVVRYERARAGELLHLDIKKLGRITVIGHGITGDRRQRAHGRAGWEFLHVAVDDATRMAYSELLPNEAAPTAAAFLARAAAWYAVHGIRRIERVMTDNGGTYVSRAFRAAVDGLRARHLRTRPYTPRTNGKVERLIRTLLTEWAYTRPFASSAQRALALTRYLQYYNTARPHTALNFQTPAQRLALRTTS